MSDAAAKPAMQPAGVASSAPSASVWDVFLQFLIIGATSFGGVVPYLRDRLVVKAKWINDKEFVEMLSISQSLPGLNATNMAVLVGEKLKGAWGAAAGVIGMCLPGAILMYGVGISYRLHGDHPWSTAALKGVAAAAVGLILATVVGLSEKSLSRKFDFFFMAATVLAVNRFHWSVPRALIIVGIVAILFHRPTGHHESSELAR
jgi:chromate transporter